MNEPYFRAGAGSVIYNDAGQILLWQRSDQPAVWQLQQGGMDAGEASIDTLWRELGEETGLKPTDFLSVHEYPHWTLYAYPESVRAGLKRPQTLGQVHRWFFLKLDPAASIDLAQAPDQEFLAYRWSDFDELLRLHDGTGAFKQKIYQDLKDHFAANLQV